MPDEEPVFTAPVIITNAQYRCGSCGFDLCFDDIHRRDLATATHFTAWCDMERCRKFHVKLRVPLQRIECDVIAEAAHADHYPV